MRRIYFSPQVLIATLFCWVFVDVSSGQNILNLSDDGWHLWLDTSATWQNDSLYLPEEVNLHLLPVNKPTYGWNFLNSNNGIEITLPSTVEEHFWGVGGFRPYKNSYDYEEDDTIVKDGSYEGVSWWWKSFEIPQSFSGKIVLLTIRGARLRAEVYLNKQLVGYNIITETSFTCDISKVMKPGKSNLLAIRITNPGGQMDWIDTKITHWGKYEFHKGHGFGGLDRNITIEAHELVYIDDLWIINKPDITKVTAHFSINNTTSRVQNGQVYIELLNDSGKLVKKFPGFPFHLNPKHKIDMIKDITLETAEAWSIDNPHLYKIRTSIRTDNHARQNKAFLLYKDRKEKIFGFRYFDASGIGTDAILELNHQRIRLISAISWGFWGLNGLFPTPKLAEKEVKAAKQLGLNCLQFHRNIGKAEVLDEQDKLGLLRYMEPGGGFSALGKVYDANIFGDKTKNDYSHIDTSGKGGVPVTFAEKYMEDKIIMMIRDHRSHPSLIMYAIQNEMSPDLNNPRIFHLLKRMHQEDPSRIIVLHSGVPSEDQAWMRPWNDTIFYDKGNGFSGWSDTHTVGGPGVWKDELYKSPVDFTHRSTNKKEIAMWGEMLGAAVPDNHQNIIAYLDEHGKKSYDYKDHEEILVAYDQFIDKWGFRKAFSSTGDLFNDIGRKSYDFWGRVIETARLSEANDFLVISGWETTAIENHSGLVDNLREFKAQPELISIRLKPMVPVIKARTLVVAKGSYTFLDLYLINETNRKSGEEFRLSMKTPSNKVVQLGKFKVPAFQKNTFVYQLKTNLRMPILRDTGIYNLRLIASNDSSIYASESILVIIPIFQWKMPKKVTILGNSPELKKVLTSIYKIRPLPYNPKMKYDLIIAAQNAQIRSSYKTTGNKIEGTNDDELYLAENYGDTTLAYFITDIPKGKTKITFKFTELYFDRPGKRVFDVTVNGHIALKDFDIFAQAKAQKKALDTSYTFYNKEGHVRITFPKIKANNAKICAFKIESGNKIWAFRCGGESYTDKNGLVWKEYTDKDILESSVYEQVQQGTSLLLLPQNAGATTLYSKSLKANRILETSGDVGPARQPWMGSWVFVRKNPVFEGLPVNCTMKSYYQLGASDANGLIVDGKNVNVFAGYSRDHDRNIGAAVFVAKYGRGKIMYLGFSSLPSAILQSKKTMHPLMAKRLLGNTLAYMNKR
jgi:beta-galactosidase